MNEKVTFDSNIITRYNANPSNNLYEVPDTSKSPSPFLLFNHSLHYWVALDKLGAEVVGVLNRKKNLSELNDELVAHCGINSQVFDSEVIPLLEFLAELKFIYLDDPPQERRWGQSFFALDTLEQYPFEEIIISLSDRCNLACTYCFNAGSRQIRLDKDKQLRRIDRLAVKKLLSNFSKIGGSGVVFTGGEPTLNPELLGFLKDAKACGLKTSLITNGTRLKHLDIDRLVAVLDALHVSIDSLDHKINAALWGVKVQNMQEDMISDLVKIGFRANKLGENIRLVLKPTITKVNEHLLKDLLIECSKRLYGFDFDFDITKFEPTDDADVNANLAISSLDYKNALNRAYKAYLQTVNPDLTDASVDYQSELFALTNAGKVAPSNRPGTLSCVPSLFVSNTGDVYPCQALEVETFRLGNVFDHSLEDFFNHMNFSKLRSQMTRDHIEICKECEFRYLCTEHCHGESYKDFGRTTAFRGTRTNECRENMIRRLWLETQKKSLT